MTDKRNSGAARHSFKTMLTLGVGAAALAFSAPAYAQDAGEEDDGTRKLQTVTITATKREKTLQDVPVAVSVVDDSVIEKAEIIDLGDLQSLVPSLSVGQLQSSANTNFIIRGFGNGANNAGIEPSVGVFIDGVYRSRSAAQISDLPNLQRVEVLRGPQSTLFGKNASAGVISVVTENAQFDWGGGVSATYGNFDTVRLAADVTGPLSETVAFSLAANYNVRDGYAEDLGTGKKVNERNRHGFRGQLRWEPTEDLSFRLIGDYDRINEDCCVAANLINGPTGAIIEGIGGNINGADPFSYEVFGNFASKNQITNSGLSLQADYDLGFATLTSITSNRESQADTNADSDFTSADLIGRNASDTELETFTQELRLTSSAGDRFDWMVGGFYFDETVDIENDFRYGADFRNYADGLVAALGAPGALAGIENAVFGPGAVGTVFGQRGQGLSEEFGQDNTSYSIFGTVDFYITDRLTLTGGLNYTNDEKDAFGRIVNTDTFSGVDLVALGFAQAIGAQGVNPNDPAAVAAFAAANPAVFDAIVAGSQNPTVNTALGLQALQFLPPFLNFPNDVEDGNTQDEDTTYSLRLAYDVNDSLNVYGSYATGFKASSWNLSRDSRPFAADFTPGSPVTSPAGSPIRDAGLAVPNLSTGSRFAGPEEAEVFEIGIKGAFDTFAFNLALFDQTIEGFQSNVFTGTGFRLLNAGEQSTTGVEFDGQWQATDALTLTFAGTFLDPTYDSFVQSGISIDPSLPFDPVTNQLDLSGTTPSGIPSISTSLGGLYQTTLSNGWDAYLRADWQYEEDTDFFDGESANVVNDLIATGNYSREVNTVNAALGFTTNSDIDVRIWGRNIFDDQRITTAFPSVAQSGSLSGYPSQPRTYGITVAKEF